MTKAGESLPDIHEALKKMSQKARQDAHNGG